MGTATKNVGDSYAMLQQNAEINGWCKVGRPPLSEEVAAETCGVQKLECRLQAQRKMVWARDKRTGRANNERCVGMEVAKDRLV